MSDGSYTVTFTVFAHPSPERQALLLRLTAQQDQVRVAYWRLVREQLGPTGHDGCWPRPKPLPLKETLAQLGYDSDPINKAYAEQAIRDESARLKTLPLRVTLGDLQPLPSLDRLTLPGLPFCPDDTQLMLKDGLAVPIDAFTLPVPFPTVLLAQGATRLKKWRAELQADFVEWVTAAGTLPPAEATKILRHQTQYGPWCTGQLPEGGPVPGVKTQRAMLGRQIDRLGQWQWTCWLQFELTQAARDKWFPAASSTDVVGVDPGEVHPLTWATANADEELMVRLIDLPTLRDGSAARQAVWARHESDYHRAWDNILHHQLVRIEITHWRTLDKPDYARRARDGYLWTCLDHAAVLAPLRATRIEWVPCELNSRTCSECGWVSPVRQRGKWFQCAQCKFEIKIDRNAARNVRRRQVKSSNQTYTQGRAVGGSPGGRSGRFVRVW